MRRALLAGLAAGAVGTIAVDVVTYLDMAVRGRSASTVPAEVAGTMADRVGVRLTAGGNDGERAGNRKSGLGALLGYGVGLGLGATWGLVDPGLRWLPRPLAAGVLGAAAMAGATCRRPCSG